MEILQKVLKSEKVEKMKTIHFKHQLKSRLSSIFIGIILIGLGYVVISPLLSVLSDTFKPLSDVYNPLIYLIPEHVTLDNLTWAMETLEYSRSMPLTALYCIGIMALQIMVASFIGYGFARYEFYGSNIVFGLVILTIVIPSQTIMVPLYMQFRYFFGSINMIDTYWPVILTTLTGVGLRSGLYIFIFRQFYKGLPGAIEEAALIDGAGPFRTYFTVMFPNAKPAIITVMLFSFVWQYNDVFFSGLFMKSMGLLPTRIVSLPSLLAYGLEIRDPNLVNLVLNAGIFAVIMPLIILYLFLQRYFMEGIERSGIVG